MPRNPTINFDLLRMYFGEPYVIDVENALGTLTVYSPTIGDVIEVGEKDFYSTLNIFICNTTQYRMPLWEMGIDWNTFPDFQLFIMLMKDIDPKVSRLLFGDVDFQRFVPLNKKVEGKDEPEIVLLYTKEDNHNEIETENPIEITEEVYWHFSQYLREMFTIYPEEKITQNDILKQWYINKDKRAIENKLEKEKKDGEEPPPSMKSIISACVNHPGFKYKLKELKDVGICEFYDSVKRLQIYEQTTAVMKGMFSGFVDSSKIKPSEYNFMRDLK